MKIENKQNQVQNVYIGWAWHSTILISNNIVVVQLSSSGFRSYKTDWLHVGVVNDFLDPHRVQHSLLTQYDTVSVLSHCFDFKPDLKNAT